MEVQSNDQLAGAIKVSFGDDILGVEYLDMLTIIVKSDAIYKVIKKLKEDAAYGFGFLTTMCGMHYPATITGGKEQLGMVYMLHSLEKNFRLRIKIYFPIEHPTVNSITDIFNGANWMEREAFDFFGIKFNGHPNLKRILNRDDFAYYPLRKNFPVEEQTRTDKNDAMFGR
ncbi:MAG: NADH-quinone oxidoreductase subunit C [Bacteroidia bacterium]|nr:NADH-quinone oxidoreductase subunit C [Bacteroidia bacterium]